MSSALCSSLLSIVGLTVCLFGFAAVQLPLLRWIASDGLTDSQRMPIPLAEEELLRLLHQAGFVKNAKLNAFTLEGVPSAPPADLSRCTFIGEGWMKKVFDCEGRALKIPNIDGIAFSECLRSAQRQTNRVSILLYNTTVHCMHDLLESFLHDIKWTSALQDTGGVPKLYSVTIPTSSLHVASTLEDVQVTVEMGYPVDTVALVQMDYRERLNVIIALLTFLDSNRHLHFGDLRRQQLVLINGTPRIADLDSVSISSNMTETSIYHAHRIYEDFVWRFVEIGAPRCALANVARLHEEYGSGPLTVKVLTQRLRQIRSCET